MVLKCPEEGIVERLSSLNMACTAFSNQTSGDVCRSLKHFQNCVKQESVYFVIYPKQGPNLERVVLYSDNLLPKQGSTAHPLPQPPSGFQNCRVCKLNEFCTLWNDVK